MPFAQAASQLDSYLDPFSGAVLLLSGGADSVFLCHALHRWNQEHGRPISALHINYCLRDEDSDADESFVRSLCHDLNIPLQVHRATHGDLHPGNLQNNARRLRRSLAESLFPKTWALLTGHHAHDQAENLLTGLLTRPLPYGISLMHSQNGRWIHPLLNLWPRDLQMALVDENKKWREDRSNSELTYRRNWIRHQILRPLMRQNPHELQPLLERIAASITSLQQGRQKSIENCMEILSFRDDPSWISLERSGFNRYFLSLQLGLVEDLGKRCGAWSRLPSLRFRKALCHHIAHGRPGVILPIGGDFQISLGRDRAFWHRRKLKVPEKKCIRLNESLDFGTNRFSRGSLPVVEPSIEFHSWKSATGDETVEIRTWKQGDRMCIAQGKHALISDIFSQAGCAFPEKLLWPLVMIAGVPQWLPGLRHAWSPGTESERNHIIWMD